MMATIRSRSSRVWTPGTLESRKCRQHIPKMITPMEKSGMKRYSHLLPKRVGTFPKPKWTGTTSGSFDTRKRNHARGTRQITRLATSIIKQSRFRFMVPTPSLNPTLRSAVSYSPLPLSAHCHANRRILVMTWLRLNDVGSASASTASWRGRGFGNSKARASCTRSAWSNAVSDIGCLPSFAISIQTSLYWREVMASASL